MQFSEGRRQACLASIASGAAFCATSPWRIVRSFQQEGARFPSRIFWDTKGGGSFNARGGETERVGLEKNRNPAPTRIVCGKVALGIEQVSRLNIVGSLPVSDGGGTQHCHREETTQSLRTFRRITAGFSPSPPPPPPPPPASPARKMSASTFRGCFPAGRL